MEYFIITGSSRGIGAALAEELMTDGARVIGISRSSAPIAGMHHVKGDLTEIAEIDPTLKRAMELVDTEAATSVTLINNAGVLEPISPIEGAGAEALDLHMRINLTAPAILTGTFIRESASWPVSLRVLNITSGAAKKAYPGWGAYCSAKAGLNMLTQVVAEEQKAKSRPVRILAVAPGVVETEMQERIRTKSSEEFPKVEKFKKLKEEGGLSEPREAARKIIGLLRNDEIPSGSIVDVREYYQ